MLMLSNFKNMLLWLHGRLGSCWAIIFSSKVSHFLNYTLFLTTYF